MAVDELCIIKLFNKEEWRVTPIRVRPSTHSENLPITVETTSRNCPSLGSFRRLSP